MRAKRANRTRPVGIALASAKREPAVLERVSASTVSMSERSERMRLATSCTIFKWSSHKN